MLHATLQMTLDGAHGLVGADILLLRLMVAILDYGQGIRDTSKPFPAIAASVHHALREFLDFVMRSNLGFQLPEMRENILNSDLRAYCCDAWKACGRQGRDRLGFADIFRVLLAFVKKPFCREDGRLLS